MALDKDTEKLQGIYHLAPENVINGRPTWISYDSKGNESVIEYHPDFWVTNTLEICENFIVHPLGKDNLFFTGVRNNYIFIAEL